MSRLNTAQVRTVLYEGPGSLPLEPEARSRVMSALLDKGFAVTSLREQAHVAALPRDFLLVLGRFTGEPPLLDRGVAMRFQQIEGMDASGRSGSRREGHRRYRRGESRRLEAVVSGHRLPRCTNCMQCLSFCLFDVYGVSADSKIQVRNQNNCKTECPACSRVCPEVAIMFPKYRHGPINGEEVKAATTSAARR